jgi:predicted phosphodiesterase
MEKLFIIGDVHGKIDAYWKLLKRLQKENPGNIIKTIQLGDFGFKKQHLWFLENIDYSFNKIVFGNHDWYPGVLLDHSLKDWSHQFLLNKSIFTIRGAWSVDQWNRTEGIDWFREEEIPYNKWDEIIDNWILHKPNIVISHDCPHSIRKTLFGISDKSLTSSGLEALLDLHKPHIWIFGHHHRSINQIIEGTQWICLKELEYIEIL